jgi:hypothetical protein
MPFKIELFIIRRGSSGRGEGKLINNQLVGKGGKVATLEEQKDGKEIDENIKERGKQSYY